MKMKWHYPGFLAGFFFFLTGPTEGIMMAGVTTVGLKNKKKKNKREREEGERTG